MKKMFLPLLLILAALLFSGCGSKRTFNTEFGALTTEQVGMNRNDAWAKVQTKKAEAAIEWLKKNQEETRLKVAEMQSVKVTLDTPEKIMAYTNAQLTKSLGDAVVALANRDKPSELEFLKSDPLPKSEFAEGVEAVGGVILGVASSPVGVASSVGYFVGSTARGIAKGNGDHNTTYGDDSAINQNKATASKSSTATVGGGSAGEEETGLTEVNPIHWNECSTSPGGTPTSAEINDCMIGYGYASTECNGGICLDGQPYNGPAVVK